MKALLSLLVATVLISCGTSKDLKEEKIVETIETESTDLNEYNIVISVSHSDSYCGGMAPTPEMLERLHYMKANTSYILLHKASGTKASVKTDSLGVLELDLVPGEYALREYFKNCTFEEFLKQQKTADSQYYQQTGGDDCYKNWWKANLLDFEITDTSNLQEFRVNTSTKCFTGNNPCLMYNGPYPP